MLAKAGGSAATASTPDAKSQTLNPKPLTPNAKPETLNPKLLNA